MIDLMVEAALRSLLVAVAVWAGLRAFRVRNVLAQKACLGIGAGIFVVDAVPGPLGGPLASYTERRGPDSSPAAAPVVSDGATVQRRSVFNGAGSRKGRICLGADPASAAFYRPQRRTHHAKPVEARVRRPHTVVALDVYRAHRR